MDIKQRSLLLLGGGEKPSQAKGPQILLKAVFKFLGAIADNMLIAVVLVAVVPNEPHILNEVVGPTIAIMGQLLLDGA